MNVHVAGGVYGVEEEQNVVAAMRRGRLAGHQFHHRLEEGLARWYGTRDALLVNSGSSANLLAVATMCDAALGDRRLVPGDEVITVACGFPTTVAPLVQHGLVPVFLDVTLPNYNIDVSMLALARTERTRAVMIAHTLGMPFDVNAVRRFCLEHDLWLVEDNCDAAGSLWRDRKTGTFGDMATLSFYPAHHMSCGEGGALLTSDPRLAKVALSLRDWGRDCSCPPGCDNTCGNRFGQQHGTLPAGYDHKYVYARLGYNLKMSEVQAAVGCAQLGKLDHFIAQRRENWRYFHAALAGASEVILPEIPPDTDPSPFGFLLTLRDAPRRNEVVQALEAAHIQTRMLFAGNLLRHPALAGVRYRQVGSLHNSDLAMTNAFWLGVYPGVTPHRAYVVEKLRGALR